MKISRRTTAVDRFALLLLAGLLISGGCHHRGLRDHCADIACGAVPAPAGTYRQQWHEEQTARAERDFFVFYLYEWDGESDRLSPFGQRHFRRTVERAAATPHPMLVEPSGDDDLDARRVQTLEAALAEYDSAWRDYPVAIGSSDAEPLYGFESPRVSRGYLGGGVGGAMGQQTGGMGGMGGGAGGLGGGVGMGGGLGGGMF